MTWTRLAVEPRNNWVHTTPRPSPTIHAATELGATADHLVHRAAEILAPPPITPSHRVSAVSGLLATTLGYNAERRITPDEIEWATTHGGTLHIIEHGDGSVTFTKSTATSAHSSPAQAPRNATTNVTSNIQPTANSVSGNQHRPQ